MDNAVALVRAYLHVNGYFTVTEHPVLEAERHSGFLLGLAESFLWGVYLVGGFALVYNWLYRRLGGPTGSRHAH